MKMTSFRRSRNARVFLLLPEPACGGYPSADGVGSKEKRSAEKASKIHE